jgi:DNA-binding YbaB/EbfC family protein
MSTNQDLLEQAQKMKEKRQRELAAIKARGKAPGVAAEIDGHKQLRSIEIDPELLAGSDMAELEQRVIKAVNHATNKMEAILERKFGPPSVLSGLF